MYYRVTIAVSPELQYQANQLALCLGTAARDVGTFGELQTTNGMYYAGARVPAEWIDRAQQPIVAPDFALDADVEAAAAAQFVMDIYNLDSAQPAATGRITAIIGPDGLNTVPVHLAAMGLQVTPMEIL